MAILFKHFIGGTMALYGAIILAVVPYVGLVEGDMPGTVNAYAGLLTIGIMWAVCGATILAMNMDEKIDSEKRLDLKRWCLDEYDDDDESTTK